MEMQNAISMIPTVLPHRLLGPGILGPILESEESLRSYATYTLHKPVEKVLEKLGVNGRFRLSTCNIGILGAPDFSWTMNGQPHPKQVIVRVPVSTCLLVAKPRAGIG